MEAVNTRVARLPEERRRQLLLRAGISPDGADGADAGGAQADRSQRDRHGWGFPTNLPPKQRLVEYLQQQEQAAADQQQAAAASGAQQQHGCWQEAPQQQQQQLPAPAQQQQQEEGQQQKQQQQQQQRRPILLELLQQSRTFQSPDCAEAMAESLGAADLHRSLRGSLLQEAPAEAEVQRMRGMLRAALRTAWSNEALRRGVCLAKAGDLKGALPCYDQALQLDQGNADALVARGAAHANQRQWQRASDDLETALQLQPQHSNARQYLEAIQSKATAGGVRLLPYEGPSSSREVAADGAGGMPTQPQPAPAHASRDADDQRQQRQQQEQGEVHLQPSPARASRGAEAQRQGQQRQREQGEVREPPVQRGHSEPVQHDRRESGGGRRDRGEGSGRKRQRASRSRSRSRSRGRRREGSRSRSRSRGRSDRRRRGDTRRSSSSGSSGSSSSSSSDSDAEATAARLAAAQQLLQQQGAEVAGGEGGQAADGMDVARALQLVASHYKSRRSEREKRERAKERRKKKKGGSKHGKQRHKKRKKQRR